MNVYSSSSNSEDANKTKSTKQMHDKYSKPTTNDNDFCSFGNSFAQEMNVENYIFLSSTVEEASLHLPNKYMNTKTKWFEMTNPTYGIKPHRHSIVQNKETGNLLPRWNEAEHNMANRSKASERASKKQMARIVACAVDSNRIE